MFHQVLLVGDGRHPEFADALRWMTQHCQLTRCSQAAEGAGFLREGQLSPELIVLAQSRPGQFSQKHIELLHQAAPLARLTALLGSWCQGETCSGQPWRGVLRVYWHEFVARMERERVRALASASPWNLPRTSTGAERLSFECFPRKAAHNGFLAIGAADYVTFECLSDACSQAGFATAWLSPTRSGQFRGLVGGIWDDSSATAGCPLTLTAFVREVHPAPVVATLNFPRHRDREQSLSAGAVAVLAKPFEVDDLITQIARATPGHPHSVPAA